MSRKSRLPRLTGVSKLIFEALDDRNEIVEDCRFKGEVSLKNVYAIAKMFQSKKECEEHQEPRARFFCYYRLEKVTGRRFRLASIHESEDPMIDYDQILPHKQIVSTKVQFKVLFHKLSNIIAGSKKFKRKAQEDGRRN